jgi:hypothetical protein
MSYLSVRISTIGELTEAIICLYTETHRRWWFRGHADAEWTLLPKIRRDYTDIDERVLSNNFYANAQSRHSNCPLEDDFAGWIALMQHYGLPTRLLDWSKSPLVAAFFCVSRPFNPSVQASQSRDAAIWALDPVSLNKSQGLDEVFYPLNANTLKPMIRPFLKGISDDDKHVAEVAAAVPIGADIRMFVQGAFTIHDSGIPLDQIESSGSWLRKYVIPADRVAYIADAVDVLGVARSNIFPDLQNLSEELTGMS